MNKKIIFKQENSIELVLKIPGRAQAINVCIPLWGVASSFLFFSICVGILLFFAVSGFKNELSVLSAKNLKKEMATKIDEYTNLITQSQIREAKIEQLDKDKPDDAQKIRELYKQYPPYKVEALQDQITQFKESIERCDLVIEQEYESIAEFTKNLALVKQRDTELKAVMK